MGKKKSAALIVLFTVVLVGLVFMSVASFPVSAVYNYNSLLSMIDLSTDLGGGYTAVYYPEGVISQEEYNALAADYEDKKDEADAPENPKDLYHQYGGVYIENESWNSDEEDVTEAFRNEFDSAFRALQNRFEQKSYSAYSIKLQDGYTIRVDVPYTDEDVTTMFDTMAYSGRLYFSDSDDTVSLASKNILMEGTSQYIREAGATAYGDGYAFTVLFETPILLTSSQWSKLQTAINEKNIVQDDMLTNDEYGLFSAAFNQMFGMSSSYRVDGFTSAMPISFLYFERPLKEKSVSLEGIRFELGSKFENEVEVTFSDEVVVERNPTTGENINNVLDEIFGGMGEAFNVLKIIGIVALGLIALLIVGNIIKAFVRLFKK